MSFISQKVNAVLSITKEQTIQNIQDNLNTIPSWFDRSFYPNGYEAIIISAGPSLEKYVTELNLKERMVHPNRSFVVFCVKHALPRLMAMGIEPDFCVILDGRPFEEESTHGFNRKLLFERIPEKTIFLVASMSHTGYAKYLIDNGARVLGWHTEVDGLKDFIKEGKVKGPVLSGGTSSGTRSISIAHALGCREITMVSFDSCIPDPTEEQLKEKDKKGRLKYMPVELPANKIADPEMIQKIGKAVGDIVKEYPGMIVNTLAFKKFYTTGELLAQAQDFETLFSDTRFDLQFKVYDDGIVSHLYTNMPIPKKDFSFIEYFKKACPKKDFRHIKKRRVNLPDVVSDDSDPVK
jgi:uncharacterized Rossmann fold enzyme